MKTYTQMKSIQDFNKKALLGALLAAGMVMGSASVSAATATGTMTVNATLTSSCSVSDSALNFGDISALAGTTDIQANTGTTLQIACSTGTTNPVIYSVRATSPRVLNGSGTAALGTMAFNLSQTSGAAADDLADASTGETILNWTANGVAQPVTIYGRIPAANYGAQPVGPYSATIAINVEYS
ncbi:MAG: spore coat protein U domain-containing protein [Methylococcaceae bacterium]|jgi:spore coat protein U-like protein